MYKKVIDEMVNKYKFKYVGVSLRESLSVLKNRWSGILYADNNFYSSKSYEIEIVDRLGGGDSFTAGLILVLLKYVKDIQK